MAPSVIYCSEYKTVDSADRSTFYLDIIQGFSETIENVLCNLLIYNFILIIVAALEARM